LEKKPFTLIDARKTAQGDAAEAILEFVKENEIKVLNVAGPRLSGRELGYTYAMAVVQEVIHRRSRSGV
jgi:hypothetical protein